LGDYFKECNQSPFAADHPPLNYKDDDRTRRWDADTTLPESSWIERLNCQAEHAFGERVHTKHPNLEGESLDKKVREQGKKKQHCIGDAETRKAVLELFMLHLEWHPLLYFNPTEETVAPTSDVGEDAWRNQTMEMYKLCEELGEP
jgi:hypothetical protein